MNKLSTNRSGTFKKAVHYVLRNRRCYKFRKIHRKKPVFKFLFNKIAGLNACNLWSKFTLVYIMESLLGFKKVWKSVKSGIIKSYPKKRLLLYLRNISITILFVICIYVKVSPNLCSSELFWEFCLLLLLQKTSHDQMTIS